MGEWSGLAPRFEWRRSQQHLLELASHVHDQRWHLAAPPGAGKTLIGLELARQVDAPTIVLAPTTAIRDQWRAATAMFGADPRSFTSDDPACRAPLLAVTYQLLGNPGEAAAELRSAARRLWVAEVADEVGDELATRRVAVTEQQDPRRASRELSRHVRALRRSLATGEDVGVRREALLGDRTAALVEHLAGLAIGCVVLDECHHLLDWWALVVQALVERLGDDRAVAIIGLTATLPDPDSAREADNYRGLLGDVDAELHLAAMVAEGAIAPWRDGVRIAQLTDTESAFLDDWTARFAADLDAHLVDEQFVGWAVATVAGPAEEARARLLTEDASLSSAQWDSFWDRDPLLAAAVGRWWGSRGLALPAGFEPPPQALGTLTLADRLTLVDSWLHDPSDGPGVDDRAAITKLARRYGVAFTTRGVQYGRSVADVVCARSSGKGPAAADLLAQEATRRGERMRALVVVERDRATTPPAAAREVLGEDAGTAARIVASLCDRPEVVAVGVVAVTGRGGWCGALAADDVCASINAGLVATGRSVGTEGSDIRGAVRLTGHGKGWTPAAWLAAAELALDDGAAQVLVATRGLVGEGWDHPALNVLVDLSEAASRVAATQLRGRALRIDATDATKVASLWDVVVVHPGAHGDWNRLRRRHDHWWGPSPGGEIITGAAKLHPLAGRAEPPGGADIARINADSLAAVSDVAATRAAWGRVDPGGVATSAVHVQPRVRSRVRTRSSRWGVLAGAGTAVGSAGVAAGMAAISAPELWPVSVACLAVSALAGVAVRGRTQGERETMLALGEAVAAALAAAGDAELRSASVRVKDDPAGGSILFLERAPDDAAARWAAALSETLGPLGTPRWLVAVGDRAWRVPAPVGRTRAGAETFAKAFRSRVPGAELVRAGTPRATSLVLSAAASSEVVGRSLRWR